MSSIVVLLLVLEVALEVPQVLEVLGVPVLLPILETGEAPFAASVSCCCAAQGIRSSRYLCGCSLLL